MAKHKKENIDEVSDQKGLNPSQQALMYLKKNKDDHYNFEENNDYLVPSSSLLLNMQLNGGIPNGVCRCTGITSGGKSSCSLDFMYNFLKGGDNRRGIFFRSEGRLSEQMKLRSGITFTCNPEEWQDSTCLTIDSNIYETIFGFIRDLIVNNPTKTKYFFIVDSVDMMLRREDVERPLEQANVVAGGALITSTFLKKVSLALNKRGHVAFFINQIREEIKINSYQASTPRQGKASGGHALEHAPSVVMDFLPRFNDDLIRENPSDKNSKIIGHWCKVKILKDDNERLMSEVRYPIKYWRTGGKSVWVEYEIVDLLIAYELLKKSTSWFTLTDSLREELLQFFPNGDYPEKIQGMDNIRKLLDDNPKMTDYLYEKFTKTLINK